MILKKHYAVVWRGSDWPKSIIRKEIMTQAVWKTLQDAARRGQVVILEAWDITQGKCVSN
jgi:hypothetical protein